jgi:hypothetical protein
MRNIGLVGRKRTGKDTAAGFLVERGYERIGFADALKDAALALDPIVGLRETWDVVYDEHETYQTIERLSDVVKDIGWERAKDESPEVRRILQHMGETIREVLGDHSWRNVALAKVEAANALGRPVVISDVRYPDEAAQLAEAGFLLARITRPGVVAVPGEHASESNTDTIPVHAEIHNGGTVEYLRREILGLTSAFVTA